jgi:ribosomal protein S18 acetylase RimI-like enzyme
VAVRTRPATEADYAVAGAICVEAYRADDQLEGAYGEVLGDVAARATNSRVIVAEDSDTGELLGCVTLALAGQPWAEVARPGEAEFRMLAVRPYAQRRGVGSALVQACLRTAEDLGATAVTLCTRDVNQKAMAMYRGFGFVRVPDRDWAPMPHIRLLAFRVELASRVG